MIALVADWHVHHERAAAEVNRRPAADEPMIIATRRV
jgi:hypothetical protein